MKLEKLFGEDIDITQEDFEATIKRIILERAKPNKNHLDLKLLPSLTSINEYMTKYKEMLEQKEIDEDRLFYLLIDIVNVALEEYRLLRSSYLADPYEVLIDTLVRKNKDYGNASIKNGGNVGNYVRMTDKFSRLKNLSGKKEINYESISDTWLDLAGYAVIGCVILILTVKYLNKEDDDQLELPFETLEKKCEKGGLCWIS